MRSEIRIGAPLMAITALLMIMMFAPAAEASSKKAAATPEIIQQMIKKKAGSVQLVTFPDTGWSAVKVVRGKAPAKGGDARKPELEKAETAETVTFNDLRHGPVRVIRGESDRAVMIPGQPRASGMNLEVVSFADPRERPVSILRGSGSRPPDFDLFAPASVADLDRVAFAVDGAESGHGADLRMWRAEQLGPQGPMQVSAAAAIDVGGGDRFDVAENRSLGRAYLARMFRRYGNWPDAIAAYNWGPGSLDAWIAEGRAADRFPLEVERYRDRVLRDAALVQTAAMTLTRSWPFRAPAAAASPPIAGALDKEVALSAIGAIGHGQRYRDLRNQSGKPKSGGKLAISAKQTAVAGR
jgi:Transglycosylase SLT domain